jgi:hypothetical protein
MVEEAKHIEVTDSPEYISQVFIALNKYLEEDDAFAAGSSKGRSLETPSLEDLARSEIFPIKTTDSKYTFHHTSNSSGRNLWFIADRWHLKQIFEGLVPLLALDVESVAKISYLIKRLNLEDRLLSKAAHGVPKVRGLSQPCPQLTLSLRAKSRSIARYVIRYTSMGSILILHMAFYSTDFRWLIMLQTSPFPYGHRPAAQC